MAINWMQFESNLNSDLENIKTDNNEEIANAITDNYHKTVMAGTNALGASPMTVNKEILRTRLIQGFSLSALILSIPSIKIPKITLLGLPTLPKLATPPIPILPGINICSFNIKLPNIKLPNIKLPSLPELPNLTLPSLPELPKIKIPMIPPPNIKLPNIKLPSLPELPNLTLPSLPELPKIKIPDLGVNIIKANLAISTGIKTGIYGYWNGADMTSVPPPGAVTSISNKVVNQGAPAETLLTDPNDKTELSRKITITASNHIKTIQGVSIGTLPNGNNLSVPWIGLK